MSRISGRAASDFPPVLAFPRAFAKLNNTSSDRQEAKRRIDDTKRIVSLTNAPAKVRGRPAFPCKFPAISACESINNEARENENNGRAPRERRGTFDFSPTAAVNPPAHALLSHAFCLLKSGTSNHQVIHYKSIFNYLFVYIIIYTHVCNYARLRISFTTYDHVHLSVSTQLFIYVTI